MRSLIAAVDSDWFRQRREPGSCNALNFLRQQGFKYLKCVKGGITAWSEEIDSEVSMNGTLRDNTGSLQFCATA